MYLFIILSSPMGRVRLAMLFLKITFSYQNPKLSRFFATFRAIILQKSLNLVLIYIHLLSAFPTLKYKFWYLHNKVKYLYIPLRGLEKISVFYFGYNSFSSACQQFNSWSGNNSLGDKVSPLAFKSFLGQFNRFF